MPSQEVGKHIYLFTHAPGHYFDACVISAHGGWNQPNGDFDVPESTTLYFYVAHGSAQDDFGVYQFRHAPPVVEPSYGPGTKCYNYELSKYQGRHAGKEGKPAETYEGIDKTLASVEEEVLKMNKNMSNPQYKSMVDSGAKKMPSRFDVATVRNRGFGGEMTLKNLIHAVQKAHKYSAYHCFFCRGPM